jgi:HlyD family secretion protein
MKALARTLSQDLPVPIEVAPATPMERLRGPAKTAALLVAVFLVGGGIWSVLAPLESAAIAGGTLEAESNRKIVQHLEGGLVGAILVREGDRVRLGQTLIRLDDTKARTTLAALQGQLWDAQAREARLLAERDGKAVIAFPPVLKDLARTDTGVAEVLAGQNKIFTTRRQLTDARIAIVRQKVAQSESEILGYIAQEEAAAKRASIILKELDAVRPLVQKGLLTRPRLLQLEREQADIDGRRATARAQIARGQQVSGEAEAEALRIRGDLHNEVATSLRETQNQIFQLLERIEAAQNVLDRSDIKAPEAGVVTDLRVHTPGGVIAAGETLMDLVPDQDKLIVHAQLRPDDIDLVRPGLEAQVRLLPFKARRVPPIDGKVIYVSADRFIEKRTDRSYYLAKVRIDEAMLKRLDGVDIMPGMPVEVMIKTGQSTVALYALAPLLDSFHRAFREN